MLVNHQGQRLDYYDFGWNANQRGEPKRSAKEATRSWREGWQDAEDLRVSDPEQYKEIGLID